MSGDHIKREITVTRVEFAVPSGAEIKDFGLVEEWAWQDYCRRHGVELNSSRWDNWCTVEARDDEIVFTFTVETQVDDDPDDWKGVSRAEAIRQATEKHADAMRWAGLFKQVKAQRDDKQAALDRVIELLDRETPNADGPPLWIAAVRTAIEGTT